MNDNDSRIFFSANLPLNSPIVSYRIVLLNLGFSAQESAYTYHNASL